MFIKSVLSLLVLHFCSGLYEVLLEFDRYETDFTVLGSFDRIRVRKFNRTTRVINGSYDLNIDLDDSHEVGITCARSALGNNQYEMLPLQLYPQPLCGFIKKYGPDYQSAWEGQSNFPFIPPEGLCPVPKGTYWAKDIALQAKYFPPVVPEGYYRCDLNLTLISTRELLHHSAFFAKLTKELTRV